jgi:hypothetical protein
MITSCMACHFKFPYIFNEGNGVLFHLYKSVSWSHMFAFLVIDAFMKCLNISISIKWEFQHRTYQGGTLTINLPIVLEDLSHSWANSQF